MLQVVFDTPALITGCQFEVRSQPVIEHLLTFCNIIVPAAVQIEAVIAGKRYLDAGVAGGLIVAGRIQLEDISLPDGNVLEHYKLGAGEKEAIALCLEKMRRREVIDFLVTDDRLAYIVADRLRVQKLLLVDLLVELVERKVMDNLLAEEIVQAIRPRYPVGFIIHTLKILREGKRQCLI